MRLYKSILKDCKNKIKWKNFLNKVQRTPHMVFRRSLNDKKLIRRNYNWSIKKKIFIKG